MSYALHIWEKPAAQPWPASVDEADKLLRTLHSIKQGQNPKFTALAQKLTGRYPCITSPEAEEMPESELAWSGGPLDGKTDGAVYGVGVRVELLDEVRPFVVEQANALGLNVSDDQAGEVFLANGKLLSVMRATAAPAPAKKNYDDVPKRRALEQIIFDRLVPLMEKHGFRPRKSDRSFRQTFPGGWHAVHLFVEDHWPLDCEFNLTVFSRFDAVTDLIASITTPDEPPKEVKNRDTTALIQDKWLDYTSELVQGSNRSYRITSHAQIEPAMKHLFSNIETRLLPVLEKYKTIEGLDALLNTVPVRDSIFFNLYMLADKHIITAYLAKNPRLESICEECLSQVKAEKYRIPILRCIEYVRRARAK